jgi:hypothetical protein
MGESVEEEESGKPNEQVEGDGRNVSAKPLLTGRAARL